MQRKVKLKRRIDLAFGRQPVELVLKNGRVVNVFNHTIEQKDIAIDQGKIIGLGEYEGIRTLDLEGRYVVPGLIDSHVHIESSMVTPGHLAQTIVPRGTTTVIADPHEIANVLGGLGLRFMLDAAKDIPLNVFYMLPSCVPATEFEHAGARLLAEDLEPFFNHDTVLGLGELMDYDGVVRGSDTTLDKVLLAEKLLIDGHAPGLSGKDLNAYLINGVRTDHECATVEEMHEKIGNGMYVAIREGSAARDLQTLLRGVNPHNERRCTFCTDDKNPDHILDEGHIDHSVRQAIRMGIDPISAIQMATLNTAECYHLRDIGAIAPGFDADLIITESLEDFRPQRVFKKGMLVGQDGEPLFECPSVPLDQVIDTVHIPEITAEDLNIPLRGDIVNVIRIEPHSLVTQRVARKVSTDKNGNFAHNRLIDILKLVVIERHHGLGSIGLGLIENFSLRGGAIASTIAHDSHNLIAIGDNDADILIAIREVARLKGGIAVASGSAVIESLPLPIAGLMSDHDLPWVAQKLKALDKVAKEQLGCSRGIDPFMTLSFLALPVIPELKLTDMGLFDVTLSRFIPIEIDETGGTS